MLVMTESGQVVCEQLSDKQFNPASVNKIITAHAAILKFGLNYQFRTTVWTEGVVNPDTGVLAGNIYVQGSDPDFDCGDAAVMLESLKAAGVRQVQGKLVVSPDFAYGSVTNPSWSLGRLRRAWSAGRQGIKFTQGGAVGTVPVAATVLVDHESEPLRATLKEMLSYSQNHVAEAIGHCLGGVARISELVAPQAGLAPGDLQLATASGLGRNRMRPKDMMRALVAFRGELRLNGLDLQDLLPVAGVDGGTLDERFVDPCERGSVIGKTGTLPGTDGGASALVGICRAQKEDLYFVIFCWRGNVVSFRQQQDQFIRKLQADRGGPRPFDYMSSL